MGKPGIKKFEVVLCILVLAAIAAGLLLPETGNLVLLDELCSILVIWIVCICVIIRVIHNWKTGEKSTKTAGAIIAAVCAAVCLWFTKDLAADLVSGTKTVMLTDIEVSESQAHTGIFSSRYYLMGTDPQGERINVRNKKRCYLMLAVLLAAVVFACAACAESPSEEQNNINEETEPQETIEITLPGSLFEFANTDLQDNLDQVEEENSEYSCELSSDYSKVVYKYDENIDGILQAKILVSLTSIYVMNGIIETNNSDWSVDASIVNCHTGKTVVQGTFPGASLTFGEAEWKASYE